uniref:Alcohol dehydrogenase n=1 Tax=uncultured Armatimonadetes bacterium TaxID=157466 RepID=A0A6J4I6P2_9BACT|nr:Alcohol dehydrogenase [uncultured Armatimonadetes bacterium]
MDHTFDWQSRTRLIFGANSIEQLGEVARAIAGRRILVVTDAGIVVVGHVDRARQSLEAAGLFVSVFDAVRENPTTRDVDACVEAARAADADVLIGLGGGSSIDTAKGANFLLTNGGTMRDYWGVGKASREMLPLIAVPTTAGTGSECQSFALIADEETHQKMACGDPKAAPRVALLDPVLTVSQPRTVTACTGLDAIAHAVESAVTRRRNAVSWLFSREAFRLTVTNFGRVLDAPEDLEARGAMLLGAAYAGIAIENSMLGAAHSMANPLTAHYGIAHGQAVGMMLPHVVRFNAEQPEAREAYYELAVSNGLVEPGAPRADAAEALAAHLTDLLRFAGMPTVLADCAVAEDALPALAVEAASQWTAQFNPREITAEEFAVLYRGALAGM